MRSPTPSAGSAARDTVNVVSMDSYVRGVIPAEMPTSWSLEALKAQAVAARTYGTWSRDDNADRWYQICDTSSCQVYRGVSAEDSRGNQAVDETRGQILTLPRRGGVHAVLLEQRRLDLGRQGSPTWWPRPTPTTTSPATRSTTGRSSSRRPRIRGAYPSIGKLNRLHVTRRDGHGQWGGRVVTVVLDGTKRNVTISGDTFRSRFGLQSSLVRRLTLRRLILRSQGR